VSRGPGMPVLRASIATSALCFALAGCAAAGPPGAGLAGSPHKFQRLVMHEAVVVRGWIGAGTVGLEPVMVTHAAPRGEQLRDGPYRLRGFDDQGAVVFDFRFGDEALSRVENRPEREFMFVAPVVAGGSATLAVVLLEAGRGLEFERRARMSSDELRAALEDPDALRLDALDDGGMRIRWDAGRFELLQVRDPASGEILALARHGDVLITSTAAELEIALSEGVRSLAGVFRAR
jgi:hypothetical protein